MGHRLKKKNTPHNSHCNEIFLSVSKPTLEGHTFDVSTANDISVNIGCYQQNVSPIASIPFAAHLHASAV